MSCDILGLTYLIIALISGTPVKCQRLFYVYGNFGWID